MIPVVFDILGVVFGKLDQVLVRRGQHTVFGEDDVPVPVWFLFRVKPDGAVVPLYIGLGHDGAAQTVADQDVYKRQDIQQISKFLSSHFNATIFSPP